ncbi:MAG: 2-oxo acid dehydrogenase subunit E2 [Caldilinea sp.]|nr:2-oxo acid dehydrogenase subunit E2 [Caldilinea sp.]MDW8440764.1 dihydrolipoamide acetyltransferase family protein [Caldilineaceae bacterium]
MPTAVVMPKQGNTVESVMIVDWKKRVGETVEVGDVLCEVETDKATMEVPSPVAGVLLKTLYNVGDEVPVMTTIAWIGEVGEATPDGEGQAARGEEVARPSTAPLEATSSAPAPTAELRPPISPRARRLAERKGVDAAALTGSGPGGRIIERDVQAAVAAQPKLTPVAKAMVAEGGYAVPAQGSGPGGRVTSKDLVRAEEQKSGRAGEVLERIPPAEVAQAPVPTAAPSPLAPGEVEIIPVKGVRKVIAERMLQSLQTTAQLTIHASADARALQALRKRFKESPEAMGLRGITINDLVLFAVARTLPAYPGLNALFTGTEIHQYRSVHLGVAVDTPRGLMVPVIRAAETLSLRRLSAEAKRLAAACLESKITPDELTGGTFTVTNLGAFGVENFTPVLNPPQVAILGVCAIQPKAVEIDGAIQFIPHIGLSLTINHQVVDGAPAARFLQALGQAIATVDLLLVG